jgi:GT2 family glycosyltransferase
MATKVLDIELTQGPQPVSDLLGYTAVLALLRWRGRPLGQVRLDVNGDRLEGLAVWQAASRALGPILARTVLEEKWGPPAQPNAAPLPSASVVVCTRHRPDDLHRCLSALHHADLEGTEVIIVDNAPSDDQTRQVAHQFPVRYVIEPRRGLNWARTRGAALATGEVVLFTDDDVMVASDWPVNMRRPFADPAVSAVTGLVLPAELETPSQEFSEQQASFSRGFTRRVFTTPRLSPLAAANVGVGASMAFRREVLSRLQLFAVALDGGTPARSGGDTYAFYRLLSLGHSVVYTPEALAWHRHRHTAGELRATLFGYTLGTLVVWLRCLLEHHEVGVLPAAAWWLRHYHWRNLRDSLRRGPRHYPLALALAELGAYLAAPGAYLAARCQERCAVRAGGPLC